MKRLVTLVPSEGGTQTVDTIEHNGLLWLVPRWIDDTESSLTMPARMICLSLLPHQKSDGQGGHDYLLNQQLPMAVLESDAPPPETAGSSRLIVVDPLKTQSQKARSAN